MAAGIYRIRFHGRGGQGMKTASRILGSAFFAEGLEGTESGVLLCALREENGHLVEVREGEAAAGPSAARWSLDGRRVAAAAGNADPPGGRCGLPYGAAPTTG